MTIEKLLVEIELKTKDFKARAEAAKQSLKGLSSEAEKAKDSISSAVSSSTRSLGRTNSAISMTQKQIQQAIAKTQKQLAGLIAQQEALGSGKVAPTEAYKQLGKELEAAKRKYEELDAVVQGNISAGMSAGFTEEQATRAAAQDKSWVESEKALDRVIELQKQLRNLEKSGDAYEPSKKYLDLQAKIESARAELARLKQTEASLGGEGGKGSKVLGWLSERARGLGKHFANFGKSAVNSFKQASVHAKMSLGQILRYAIGVRSLFALFSRVKSAAKEGFSNLSQYSGQTAKDLARLKGSLTQVKDSLAVAFAPVVTAIAPYVQTLVNLITTACNALAMFFGALTGQSTITVAKSGLGDIAAGAAGAADATGAANSAAQDYQRTLMGFDQINKLDDKSGSGGGGGAGGVGGAAGFGTAEIENVYSNWAEKIKEAWANADFYSIGQAIGTKIRDGLDSINWDSIKAVGERIARSIATGLNGFLETPGLFTAVGKTIAEALNTVFNTANTFATAFNWSAVGQAIGDSINSFFANFDFVMAAKTISNMAKGLFDSIISAVKRIDWGQIGRQLADFIANIDWIGMIGKAIELAGLVIKGVADFAINFIKTLASRILEWLYGLIKGHNEAVLNVKLNGKEDQSFTKTKADYEAMRDKPTTVTTRGQEHSTFINTQKDFNGMASKTATVTLKASSTLDAGTKAIRELINAKSSKNFTFSAVGGIITMIPKAATMANGGIFQNGSWKPITAAANGGNFSTGQLFLAREAGPELVGSIGGHTAVMNNSQIVSSVSEGVYKAVLSAMSQQGGNTPITVTLEGDARGLFRMVRAEARNYTNATGLSAFPV